MAQEKPKPVAGAPPIFASVTEINKEKGEFTLGELQPAFKLFQIIVELEVNGKREQMPKTVTKVEVEKVTRTYSLQKSSVYNTSGKKLNNDEVWKRLTVGANLVVSTNGRLPEAGYLALLGTETLVLVSPEHVLPERAVPEPK